MCLCASVFEKLADQTAYGDGRTVVQLPAEGGGGAEQALQVFSWHCRTAELG